MIATMISILKPLLSGNSIRVFLAPPLGAKYWRVLRKAEPGITGPDDEYALTVYEGDEKMFVDVQSLQNEVMQFYRPFYRMPDDSWQAGPETSGTAEATYQDDSTDVLSMVRQRLEVGLQVEVLREVIASEIGHIQVFTAPPSMDNGIRFPLVTVHLDGDSSSQRAIGEDLFGDQFDAIGGEEVEESGWLAQVQLSIIGWSLNSDQRIDLRKAIRRIIVANLEVFDAAGMIQIDFNQQDVDAVSGEYGPPMYQVMGSFSCLAPVRVGRRYGPDELINDIDVRSTNE